MPPTLAQGVLEPEPWEAACRAATGLSAAIGGATSALHIPCHYVSDDVLDLPLLHT